MERVNYAGNSEASKVAPVKEEVSKVISGEVSKKKKSLGAKFRETFLATDGKTAATYVVNEVLLPSARDMLFDAIAKGANRLMYGDRATRSGPGVVGGKTAYNAPVNRTFSGVQTFPFSQRMFQQPAPSKNAGDDFILSSREDAEIIIDTMNEHIQQYGFVTVYDLKKMLGMPPEHTDNKWGWESLRGAQMRQVRNGWLMDLPNPKQI